MEIQNSIESPVMARKRSKTSPSTENTDWISNLPDALLSHILSFLPTEESVRTRILSTRWKHLFTIVPILDFFNPTSSDSETTRSFLDFVSWVFNSYNVDRMDKFCYSACGVVPETSRLLSWITEAVRRGVQELQVTEVFHERQLLPRGIYTCKTLTVLKIQGRFDVEVPDDVCLPRVRTLHLLGVNFVDGSSAGRFFRSCHVLEDLSLSCCFTGGDGEVFNISVPTLKNLKIYGYDDKFNIELGVPKLELFEYDGHLARSFVAVQDLKSLVKACIGFLTYEYYGYEALDKLIGMVCHVQHLGISAFTLEAFQRTHLPLQTFRNLTHLEIRVISRFDSRSVLDFLDKTPLLEVLVVDNGWCPREEYVDNINQRGGPLLSENVPACVRLRLREIEFRGFLMLDYECQLVEYFLKNAKILDTLKIMCKGSLENQFEMSKKLLTFSRCSRACHIILDSAMGEC